MAKNTNTFLKKKREMDKRAKAEAKLARRIERKKRASQEDSVDVCGNDDNDPASSEDRMDGSP